MKPMDKLKDFMIIVENDWKHNVHVKQKQAKHSNCKQNYSTGLQAIYEMHAIAAYSEQLLIVIGCWQCCWRECNGNLTRALLSEHQ